MIGKIERRAKIRAHIRSKISGTAERPRMSVFRSNAQIYAQIIDDVAGTTLAAASSLKITEKMTKKEQAAKFSFLMVLVPILGEAFLGLMKGEFSGSGGQLPVSALLTGFFAAFVAGTIACKWMLEIVKRGKLAYFAYYCIAVGAILIVYSQLG